jgi:fused signal recognition particle receptor
MCEDTMVEESGERKGFWGSTLSKLKTALSKTKTQISGSMTDDGSEGDATSPEQSSQTEQSYQSDQSSKAQEIANETDDAGYPRSETTGSAARESTVGSGATPIHSSAATSVQEAPPPVPKAEVRSPSESVSSKHPAVPIDDDFLEDLEDKLIKSDIGITNVQTMVGHLRKEARGKSWTTREVISFLKSEFQGILKTAPAPELKYTPGQVNIYLVVGVNGTGKTTSIGKLSWRFKQEGKKVLLAAGDTFRAAAESQLEIWSDRAGVDIVRLGDNADPGAVVFTAIDKAKKENYDCLIIDTAGRLHNKTNLMAELGKIRGVVEKHGQGLPLECLLVLDASTGQNGLQQAKLFTEVCKLTGVILTKLDGTAKGGVVFSIARDLKIPVKLIGLGEKMDELRDFEPDLFVEALF